MAEELEENQDKDTSPSENISSEIYYRGLKVSTTPKVKLFPSYVRVLQHLEEVNGLQNVPYAFGSKKTQGVSTPEEVKRMQNVPYVSPVGSIINTKDMFLVYGGNPKAELRVDCYCDDGFETDRDDIKSQTGYVFVLNGGAVDWKSSK
ncbi:hypothetical protein Tco_1089363 [Tanacetum coccineum]